MSRQSYSLQFIPKDAICAEIGVWHGGFSRQILAHSPKKLHLIDPWEHQDYKGRLYFREQEEMDSIYNMVATRYAENDSVDIHRAYSTDVDFSEEYFDYVYIDGNHSYDFVLADLNHYYKFMKKGGFLCGDDFKFKDSNCRIGPKKAVEDFCKTNDLKFTVHRRQFVIPV